MNTVYYVDDLVFIKKGQGLSPLCSLTKPTSRILPLRVWEHSNSFHGKLESNLFVSLKKNLLIQIQRGSLEYFFPSVSMFFQGQFGDSSYLAEKNWSPSKRVHSPLCGLEAFPTYRCYKKLLMFLQGPTICFSRYREGRQGDEWGFIYPAGWLIQGDFPTQNPHLSLLYSSTPPAPFSFWSLGGFPFTLSCWALPPISKK